MDELVLEAETLLQSGAFELNIIAQDTSAFGLDRGRQELHELLRRLAALPQRKWIRLLYTHPAHYYDELIDVLAGEPDICPYLDIPLQHVSDRLLERMGRKVKRGDIERLIEKLRSRIPRLALRTTLLVGFPGETDEEFRELLDFVNAARFERLGAFIYSREEGTAAAALPDQVPDAVKRERFHLLMTLQREIACSLAKERIGERTQALVEEPGRGERRAVARSPREAPDLDPVILIEDARRLKAGDIAEVEITGSEDYDCVARIVEKF
jgi:ribosomal protein S12 methylthiotransferase